MSVCRIGCGRAVPKGGLFCLDHLLRWVDSPEIHRCAPGSGRARAALVDFIRRAEAEDRIDALRVKGAMAPAEQKP